MLVGMMFYIQLWREECDENEESEHKALGVDTHTKSSMVMLAISQLGRSYLHWKSIKNHSQDLRVRLPDPPDNC